jgi:hypothetical protein
VQDEPLYLIDGQRGVVSAGGGPPFSDLPTDTMLVRPRKEEFQGIFVRMCERAGTLCLGRRVLR